MSDAVICPLPTGRCADPNFRLAVYEAGHALSARAMGFRVLKFTMLPRPPILESDKVLRGNSIAGLVAMLENRAIELFGGQIAEDLACSTSSCCSGDVSRIDELTRLISGLRGDKSPDDTWFDLEDFAMEFFKDDSIAGAIVPIAEFLYEKVKAGETVIAGDEIEELMDRLIGAPAKPGKVSSLLNKLAGRS